MIILEAFCPKCGDPLEVYGDDSSGMPDEVGTECDCGAIPVWKLEWWVEYKLGSFSHYEREGKEE